MKHRVAFLVTGMGLALLLMGALRFSATHPCLLTPLAGLATAGYVLVTILFTVGLIRAGRWSIWPSALAHGLNNTIGILELYRG